MPEINLTTAIKAPIHICFDLCRSIDLHLLSTAKTGEKAIAGRTSGLINLNETVTWRAKHFGIWQELTSVITALDWPFYFEDQMVKGAFESFRHAHYFSEAGDETILKDQFIFASPLGGLGHLANFLFLTRYMRRLLEERNAVIKAFAELGKWQELLPN